MNLARVLVFLIPKYGVPFCHEIGGLESGNLLLVCQSLSAISGFSLFTYIEFWTAEDTCIGLRSIRGHQKGGRSCVAFCSMPQNLTVVSFLDRATEVTSRCYSLLPRSHVVNPNLEFIDFRCNGLGNVHKIVSTSHS